MTKTLREFLQLIPADFPLVKCPYGRIAEGTGITESELIERLSRLKDDGVIRRIAAILAHRRASYTHNAMVVWNVPDAIIEETGRKMAANPAVSHCYERDNSAFWKYSLYTMIHGRSKLEMEQIVKTISAETGIEDYRVLETKREFKKSAFRVHHE